MVRFGMNIRLATLNDLEAMTGVLIGASPLDPVYPYRFPDRHLYPSVFSNLCRQKCVEYLATSAVVVCEMPSVSPDGPSSGEVDSGMQVVAFAAWDTPASQASLQSGGLGTSLVPATENAPLLTIGHKDRMDAFKTACARNKTSFFDATYGKRGHVMLKILLCHPDYQRRGAGRALTEWGIQEARRLGLCTTVFASPMGLRLYKKLGFREMGRFKVQLEGDEEFLEIPALVLRPTHLVDQMTPCGIECGSTPLYASSAACV
ncbi:acyl-CoA N-acyltransferase [Podospora australis]|uniref:Acyl-CoA N-acyltransferase n=1 Tax=Podospora australis TaxID=1536484 RepID=A0AAN7AE92_9PEZI|nr:acyl-CoA N-acyltransferase [Podospora australis]